MTDDLTPEQSNRLAKLNERLENFKQREVPAKDRKELHEGFVELASMMRDLYDIRGESLSPERTDLLGIFEGFEKITGDNPEKASEGADQIFGSKSFKRFRVKQITSRMPLALTGVALQDIKAKFDSLPDADQKQARYLQKIALTDDAFGIMVRGHVLVENALQACIHAYVPNPTDLYRKLEMFFSQKIGLAYMLGVISKDEKRILDRFNSLRNKLAHHSHGVAGDGPDFHLSQEHEGALWKEFVQVPSMSGDWPDYDETTFPTHLRYIVMQMYFTFSARAGDLKARKLDPVVNDLIHGEDPVMLSYFTKLSVDLLTAVGK